MGNSLLKNRRTNRVVPNTNFENDGPVINEYYTPAHPIGPPPSIPRNSYINKPQPYIIESLNPENVIRFNFHDGKCCICLDKSPSVILNCGHTEFCYSCIIDYCDHQWNNNKVPTCPICRATINKVSLGYILDFNI